MRSESKGVTPDPPLMADRAFRVDLGETGVGNQRVRAAELGDLLHPTAKTLTLAGTIE
jgi:hypothetical protein